MKINSIKRSLSFSLFFDEKIDSIITFWGSVYSRLWHFNFVMMICLTLWDVEMSVEKHPEKPVLLAQSAL